MARVVDVSIPTAGGRTLGARVYQPAALPVGRVVLHGATAVPQVFYRGYAEHLAAQGFRVLTYDYRGVGRSRAGSVADDPVTMRDWIDDARAAQQWLAARAPAVGLVAIGHSFGGQIAAAIDSGARPDALVLVGAQSGFYGAFPELARARLWLSWRVIMPMLVGTMGYLPAWTGIGEDLPAGVARQWARWCLSPDYFLSELPELAPRLRSYGGPVLALSFHDDDFAPLANVQWLLDRLASASIDHHHLSPREVGLPEIGHFGFFRRTAAPVLWSRVDAFLAAAVGRDTLRPMPRTTDLALQEVLADLAHGRN